nr:unnamed protein product [Spirometra erinaceieuropaei]
MYQGDGIYYFNDHEKTYIRRLEELFQNARSIIDSMPSRELPAAFRLAFRLLDRTGKIICLSRIRPTSSEKTNGIPLKSSNLTDGRDFYSHPAKSENKTPLSQEDRFSDASAINLSVHALPPSSDGANDLSDVASQSSCRDMSVTDILPPLPPTTTLSATSWPPKSTYSQRFSSFTPLPKDPVGGATNEEFEGQQPLTGVHR